MTHFHNGRVGLNRKVGSWKVACHGLTLVSTSAPLLLSSNSNIVQLHPWHLPSFSCPFCSVISEVSNIFVQRRMDFTCLERAHERMHAAHASPDSSTISMRDFFCAGRMHRFTLMCVWSYCVSCRSYSEWYKPTAVPETWPLRCTLGRCDRSKHGWGAAFRSCKKMLVVVIKGESRNVQSTSQYLINPDGDGNILCRLTDMSCRDGVEAHVLQQEYQRRECDVVRQM